MLRHFSSFLSFRNPFCISLAGIRVWTQSVDVDRNLRSLKSEWNLFQILDSFIFLKPSNFLCSLRSHFHLSGMSPRLESIHRCSWDLAKLENWKIITVVWLQVSHKFLNPASRRHTVAILWPWVSRQFPNPEANPGNIVAVRCPRVPQPGTLEAYSVDLIVLSFPKVPQPGISEAHWQCCGFKFPKSCATCHFRCILWRYRGLECAKSYPT